MLAGTISVATGRRSDCPATIFADWAVDFAEEPNSVCEKFTGLGDPNNKLWQGYWALEPGEALLIEAVPPECTFWNFQPSAVRTYSSSYCAQNQNAASAPFMAIG